MQSNGAAAYVSSSLAAACSDLADSTRTNVGGSTIDFTTCSTTTSDITSSTPHHGSLTDYQVSASRGMLPPPCHAHTPRWTVPPGAAPDAQLLRRAVRTRPAAVLSSFCC